MSKRTSLSICIILGLMGAFFWAIRGTSGYGGAQGGLLAGLGWAILWHVFSTRDGMQRYRPYGSHRMIAAIVFGVAVGGLTGYGVYIAWLQGKFYLNYPEEVRAIAPWTGYAMLFFCGLHWGGITGAFMSWCAPNKPLGASGWFARIGLGMWGAFLAGKMVHAFPQWFLPFYAEGLYDIAEYATCRRAMGSVQNIAPHVGLFLGFFVCECVRRDWRAVKVMGIMSLGFALSFSIGGIWQTMHGSAWALDWWKNWEMSIGLGGGLSLGLVFYVFNQPESRPRAEAGFQERFWGAAFPVWLASSLTFMNALKGVASIHELTYPTSIRTAASLAFVIPATVLLIGYATLLRKNKDLSPLPDWACLAVLLLIIIAGYAVSLPLPLRLGNGVLLALYTAYIGISALLFATTLPPPGRQPPLRR